MSGSQQLQDVLYTFSQNAFSLGVQAGANGNPKSDNPYTYTSGKGLSQTEKITNQQHDAWDKGWELGSSKNFVPFIQNIADTAYENGLYSFSIKSTNPYNPRNPGGKVASLAWVSGFTDAAKIQAQIIYY